MVLCDILRSILTDDADVRYISEMGACYHRVVLVTGKMLPLR